MSTASIHSKRLAVGSSVVVLVLGALLLGSCSKRDGSEDPAVLARVGDVAITVDDLQGEVARLRRANRPVPEKEALLQELVRHEALVQRARQAGLDQRPEVRRELNNLLIAKLLDAELAERLAAVEATETELRAVYEQDPAQHQRPAKVRLAMVHVATDRVMSDAKRIEVRTRIEEARRRAVAQPAPGGRGLAAGGFGEVAVEFSDDQASRYRGGDLGWLEAGNLNYPWPRGVLEAGYALEPGVVSEVIETERGLYLVMKTDVRAAVTVPFEQVAAALRQRVLAEKKRALETAYREEAVRQAAARIHRDALAAVVLAPETNLAQRREAGPPALPAEGAAGGAR